MFNKIISIVNNELVIDGLAAKALASSEPASPVTYDAYYEDIPCITLEGDLTGETVRCYYVWNGVGWATISGNGESVTINE